MTLDLAAAIVRDVKPAERVHALERAAANEPERDELILCRRCGGPVHEDRLYCETCRGFQAESV